LVGHEADSSMDYCACPLTLKTNHRFASEKASKEAERFKNIKKEKINGTAGNSFYINALYLR
jgi:hypothetical protein